MTDLMPYSTLTRVSGEQDVRYVQVVETHLHNLLRQLVASVDVDESWYRRTYQDVDDAIRSGKLSSASEHYAHVGYFEGRFPREFVVDADWYLNTYLDVADSIARGTLESAQEHFDRYGYKEGRIPFEGWKL